jgi:5-methylcytosine-specific restriction endonuclease McrA
MSKKQGGTTYKDFKKPLKKTKPRTISTIRGRADKLFQEIGRIVYDRCFVCGGEYSCLHHFVKKSQSTALRYNWKNGIPLCHSCHASIHVNLNDITAGKIVFKMGEDWLKELEEIKRKEAGKSYGIKYYQTVLDDLNNIRDLLN